MISKKTVVYTSGTFDMLHINHLRMIEYARGLGDILILGVNTDELVIKHKSNPIIPFTERIELVRALKWPNKPSSFGLTAKADMLCWQR
jgi:choline-phosphate cytidylyltransferase/glycerol-3-phosphate cytidylyltransferase